MLCMTPDKVVIQVTIKDWLKCRGELNGQAQNPMIGITGRVLHYLMSLVLFDYSQNTALPRSKDGCCVEDVRVSTKIVRLAGVGTSLSRNLFLQTASPNKHIPIFMLEAQVGGDLNETLTTSSLLYIMIETYNP